MSARADIRTTATANGWTVDREQKSGEYSHGYLLLSHDTTGRMVAVTVGRVGQVLAATMAEPMAREDTYAIGSRDARKLETVLAWLTAPTAEDR